MLIKKEFYDITPKLTPNGSPNRIFVISPVIQGYPAAKFPGVVVFRFVGAILEECIGGIMQLVIISEIYQVTGPVERFAGQIASQGFVVACPSSFHEFEGPDPIPYDTEGTPLAYIFLWFVSNVGTGTDRGNKYKVSSIASASYISLIGYKTGGERGGRIR